MARVVYPGSSDSGKIGDNAVARKRDMIIYQGDDFSVNVGFGSSPTHRLNMTGWQAYCSFKRAYSDATPVVSAETTIRSDGLSINISLPASVTSGMTGKYLYDLELVNLEGKHKTYMYGEVEVIPEVTRTV